MPLGISLRFSKDRLRINFGFPSWFPEDSLKESMRISLWYHLGFSWDSIIKDSVMIPARFPSGCARDSLSIALRFQYDYLEGSLMTSLRLSFRFSRDALRILSGLSTRGHAPTLSPNSKKLKFNTITCFQSQK